MMYATYSEMLQKKWISVCVCVSVCEREGKMQLTNHMSCDANSRCTWVKDIHLVFVLVSLKLFPNEKI